MTQLTVTHTLACITTISAGLPAVRTFSHEAAHYRPSRHRTALRCSPRPCCRCRKATTTGRPGHRGEPWGGGGGNCVLHDAAGEGMVEDDGHGVDAAAPVRAEPEGSWPLAGHLAS